MTIALLALGSYLVGSLPFGYLAGRLRGVDLFAVGSGNIGATNVGRVLGRKFGLLVFALDLLKGAVPVAVARFVSDDAWAPVVAAAAAFLGHLFPVFLGFRGGKGVATGAGTVLVLVPGPAAVAVGAWILCVLVTRIVSLSSIVAVVALAVARLIGTRFQLDDALLPATLYCLAGAALVIVKHRANLKRLVNGTENTIGDGPMRQSLLRVLHVLAVGLWFGGAGFFNLGIAPSLFRTFDEVARTAPSDRTANQPLGVEPATEQSRKALGSALAGAAVGPIFPLYFALITVCGTVALGTAFVWRREPPGRARFLVAIMALACVLAGWPISNLVAELRLARLSPESTIAEAARSAFATWHLVSLALSLLTVLLAGVLLALAAWLPRPKVPATEPLTG